MRRNELQRPNPRESFITILRKMREYDIHLGGLVQDIINGRMGKRNVRLITVPRSSVIGDAAELAVRRGTSATFTRWPEIWLKIKRLESANAATHAVQRDKEIGGPASRLRRLSVPQRPSRPVVPRRVCIARELQALNHALPYDALENDAQEHGLCEDAREAAGQFDTRHLAFAGATKHAVATLKFDAMSLGSTTQFRHGVKELFRNRYVTNEEYDPFTPPPRKFEYNPKRKQRKWRHDAAIWAPRLESTTILPMTKATICHARVWCSSCRALAVS